MRIASIDGIPSRLGVLLFKLCGISIPSLLKKVRSNRRHRVCLSMLVVVVATVDLRVAQLFFDMGTRDFKPGAQSLTNAARPM
jgi:hypothetical protein